MHFLFLHVIDPHSAFVNGRWRTEITAVIYKWGIWDRTMLVNRYPLITHKWENHMTKTKPLYLTQTPIRLLDPTHLLCWAHGPPSICPGQKVLVISGSLAGHKELIIPD